MPELQIQRQNGDVQSWELTREQPVSIGRHSSNDVVVDAEGVAVMHCRIAWKGDGYEVVAANMEGVEVNGTQVRSAPLHSGDVLRVGPVDVTMHGNDQPAAVAAAPGARQGRSAAAGEATVPPEEIDDLEGQPVLGRSGPVPVAEVVEDYEDRARPSGVQFRERFRTRAVRPGERSTLRSPLVLGLAGFALVLILAAWAVWFTILREDAGQRYEAAVEAYSAGKYADAIILFNGFLEKYPNHDLSDDAEAGLGKARIDQQIAGAAPDWIEGLNQVDQFIEANRDSETFHERHETLREYGRRIAEGSAQTAEASTAPVAERRKLLETSEKAQGILDLYSEDGAPPKLMRDIDALQRSAERAITKSDTLFQGVADIERAIKAKKPMQAL
ncbi:MAG: FHA domain-containing protein, partial [Planctomycetaceae bacterium]